MASVLEWATFGLDLLRFILGWAVEVAIWVAVYLVVRSAWSSWTEGQHGDMPPPGVLFRRLWCRHRKVALVKTAGLVSVGRLSKSDPRQRRCLSCGVDIDKGRRELDQR